MSKMNDLELKTANVMSNKQCFWILISGLKFGIKDEPVENPKHTILMVHSAYGIKGAFWNQRPATVTLIYTKAAYEYGMAWRCISAPLHN
jgi:hypothetical protein